MNKFKSIESLKHAISAVRNFCNKLNKPLPVIQYKGFVKLHGTNAGIRRTPSGKIQPQSRERIIDVGSDNNGFAFFVEANKESITKLFDGFPADADVTLFGEWCGGSIQKSVALSGLPKHWVLFSIALVNDEYVEIPADLHNNEVSVFNIQQIPTYNVEVDFTNPAPASEIIADLTIAVEEECPWAKTMFNTSGTGEGIVWIREGHPNDDWAWFKTKGLKHKGNDKTKGQKIRLTDQKMESIEALVTEILPEWRLEQGITFIRDEGLPLLPESTGAYLQWIARDILKEEISTIAASGFEWKQIQGNVMRHSRNYFLTEIQKDFSDV